MAVLLMSTAMVFSSCKKDEDPAPVDPCQNYIPTYEVTAIPYTQGGLDYMSFVFTCYTDDCKIVKVIVKPPALPSLTYDGGNFTYLLGDPLTVSDDFLKLPGVWTLSIIGSVASGTCINTPFTSIATLAITKK